MHVDADPYFHLTHCSNVLPGERWAEHFERLAAYVLPLKARLAPDRPFGLGLRLAAPSAAELADPTALEAFRAWLAEHDLYVFTVNGFPYGAFHGQRVKDDVYRPDWRSHERIAYTLDLVRILGALVPEGVDGGISTSPLSYKPWLGEEETRETFRASARHLAEVAVAMAQTSARTGRDLHLDIEPEPHCLLETSGETIDFFERWLLPVGGDVVRQALGVGQGEAEALLRRHVALCYDACHLAVAYERPTEALDRLEAAGIRIGRLQISSALDVALGDAPERHREALGAFVDEVYLHQVNERRADGARRAYPDLPDALEHLAEAAGSTWRIHFHVPVFAPDAGPLGTTQSDLLDTLRAVQARRSTPHLEIETYTWEVLPPALKLDLLDSIEREYSWVLDVLRSAPSR